MDLDLFILQETHVNFSQLHDIRKFWYGEVIISSGKTQIGSVLVLAKRTAPPIEQIIADPAGRYGFFKIKNTTDAVLASSGTMKEWRIDRQMFIRKIKKLLYKKITRKNNLILLGDLELN